MYTTKILPILAYACPAWFIYRDRKMKWQVTQRVLTKLKNLQRDILLQLCHARKQTPVEVLAKEMHILPIHLQLNSIAMRQRIRTLQDTETDEVSKEGERKSHNNTMGWSDLDLFPDYGLFNRAAEYERALQTRLMRRFSEAEYNRIWENRKAKDKQSKLFLQGITLHSATEEWETYIKGRKERGVRLAPAYEDRFERHQLSIYGGLSSAQATLLLAMRTGNIGLNANMFQKKVRYCSPSGKSPANTI